MFGVKVSHTTIGNWCTKFAPMFDNMRLELMPMVNLNSDEWHTDETVIKIAEQKHYIWFIIDSETRFIIECFHKQFKAWYKTKQGFACYNHANNLIATFIFFFNFVLPHLALGGLTPAQVAGVTLTRKQKKHLLLIV